MGVLMRGVQMPKNCEECNFKGECRNYWDKIREAYTRPSWCPLVEVADTPQTEEICERCVYVRGSQWCQGCNGTPKRWDGEKIVDTPQTKSYFNCDHYEPKDEPQTESTGSPIGDYRDGVGAWQTDCDDRYAVRTDSGEVVAYACPLSCEQTDCAWREPNEADT